MPTLPDCMMPDGCDPCAGFRELQNSGWLIERHFDSECRYWTGAKVDGGLGSGSFHPRAEEGVRFARYVDAATVLSALLGGIGRVAQHVFDLRMPASEDKRMPNDRGEYTDDSDPVF